MTLNDSDKNLSKIIQTEALWYLEEAKIMLKLIELKNAIRDIFKRFGKGENYQKEQFERITKAMEDLGYPFSLFASIFQKSEFKAWLISLRKQIFGEQPNHHLLNLIENFRSFVREKPLLKQLIDPRIRNSLDLGLDTAKLAIKMKELSGSTMDSPEEYRKNIIEQVDELFDSTDWSFTVHCISYLKVAFSDTLGAIHQNITFNKKYSRWNQEQLKNDEVKEYFNSELLLRTIRNALMHTHERQATKDVTWYEVYNPRRGKLGKAKESKLGEIIWNDSPPDSSEKLKDTITFECLERMVESIRIWILEVIDYILP